VDAVWLVAEPYYRSLETVRRMAALVAELPVPLVVVVANKVRTPSDEQAIAEFCSRHGLQLVAAVPWSDEVVAADRARVPVVDWPGAQAVVGVVRDLYAGLATGRPAR
jgi:CO dehydrogenase maturation factor